MENGVRESKARVVRCLNCLKLLPKLADTSLYRCGGCGVTLPAKGSSPRIEPSSDKLDGIEVKFPEISERTSENKAMVSDASLEPDLGTNPDETGRQEETALSVVSENEANITTAKKNCLKVDDQTKKSETECYRSNGLYQPTLLVDDIRKSGKAIVETISHEGRETEQLVDESFYAQQAVVRDASNDWNPRAFGKGVQLASYFDEGPSNYHQNPRGAFAEVDFDKKQNLAPIQMELLRMLDELRDQLQKSCEVTNKQKMSVMVDRSMASSSSYTHHIHANTFHGDSFPFNRNLSRRTSRESQRNASKLASFPNVPSQSSMPGYGDLLVNRKAPFHLAMDCSPRSADNCNGRFDHNSANFPNPNRFYHQPACLCLHCNGRQFSGVARSHQTTLGYQGSYFTNNSESPRLASPLISGSRSYNSKSRSVPSTSHEPQVHRRALFDKHAERVCHSFAGGAPFVICNYCFELLELPGKSLLLSKKMNKLRCGACSKLISVYCDGSRNVASKDNDAAVNSDQHTNERLVLPCVVTSSDHGMIEKPHGLKNMNELEDMKRLSSTSATFEHNVILEKGLSNSADIPFEPQNISGVPSLPIHECLGSSMPDQATDRWGNGKWKLQ